MRRGIPIAILFACALGVSARSAAQQPVRARFEVSGGARWIGPIDFGQVPANETAPGGGTRALFLSDTTLEESVGANVTFGVRLSGLLRAEVAAAYNPTHLTSRISADVEGVPDIAVDAPVTQYLIEGGLVAQPPRWQSARVSPFLTGGIGYLRQVDDGRTLIETGRAYYVGGGLYYGWSSSRPRKLKASGVRVDARALIMQGGVAPDDTSRTTPAVTASVYARF